MNPIKNTTLLDAVAMAIQYEKDCFDFYLKNFESSKEGSSVKEFFQQLAEEFHQTLLIVTHDNEFAKKTQRIIEMEDGRIIKQ